MKRISIALKITLIFTFFSFKCFSQEFDEVWKLLLSNKRNQALSQLKTVKNYNNNLEGLLLDFWIKNQMGEEDLSTDFIKEAIKFGEEFEHIFYALEYKPMFLYSAEEIYSFANDKMEILKKYPFKHSSIKNSLDYILFRHYLTKRKYEDRIDISKSIQHLKKWQVVGPFENLNKSGLDKIYEPEINPDLSHYDANSNGTVGWYHYSNEEGDPYVTLKGIDEYGSGTSYLKTYINNPEEKQIKIKIGTNAAFKIFVNNKEIFSQDEEFQTDFEYFNLITKLAAGQNLLMIKISHAKLPYISCRIIDEEGKDINDQQISAYGKGINTNHIEVETVIEKHPTIQFFEKNQNKSSYYSKIALSCFYQRNGNMTYARNILEKLLEEFPNSSFVNALLLDCLENDEAENKTKEILASMAMHDSLYYIPFLMKIVDFNHVNALSSENFEKLVSNVQKTMKSKFIGKIIDIHYLIKKNDQQGLIKIVDDLINQYWYVPKIILDFCPSYAGFGYQNKKIDVLNKLWDENNHFGTLSELVNHYTTTGDTAKVSQLIERDKKIFDRDYYYRVFAGRNYFANANYNKAKEEYNAALKLFPHSYSVLESLGDIELQLKNEKDGIDFYKKSLSHYTGNYSLRKKLKNLEGVDHIMDKVIDIDQYEFIKSNRGKTYNENIDFAILKDETNAYLYDQGGVSYRIYIVYEILKENGIERLKELNLDLYTNYHIFHMEAIKRNGQTSPAELNGSYGVFSNLEVGDVIYIDYEFNSSSYERFHKDFYGSFQVGAFVPSREMRYRVFCPSNIVLNYKTENYEKKPIITNLDNYTVYEWLETDLKESPLEESYMHHKNDILPNIYVSTIKDWNVIAEWYSDLVNQQFKKTKIVESTFNFIFPNGYKEMSELKRAQAIYEYICTNMKYSHVSFLQSGFVPQKPEKTIKTKLGDCKDFSTLFAILAEMAELQVNLVLVNTYNNGQKSLVLPNTGFNHCIVKAILDGKEYYIELTDSFLPFLAVPYSLINASALEIPKKTGINNKKYELFTINPINRLKDTNKTDIIYHISDEKQWIEYKFEISGSGASYFNEMSKKGEKYYKQEWETQLSKYNIKEFVIDKITWDTSNYLFNPIKVSIELTIKDNLIKMGKSNLIPQYFLANIYTQDILTETRNYSLDYNNYENRDSYLNSLRIILENGGKFTDVPDNLSTSFKSNEYSLKYNKISERELLILRDFKTEKKDINPEDFKDFKLFVRNILEAEQNYIGMSKSN